ncbi:hypothetical protein [Sphingomonas sp. NIBR02145]|uniref:hypothetical protein n=1 Tax=Sphingomonas sp. NIBR02145 TaxID=3014784 RepID=UPI0022B502FE|nr:hypothetical protein [Sphingomonas sp. NIBR02145]WHU01120.1 hypothetical protein O3305_12955 [Sphingomonas sp. NIBR02145]
MPGLLMIYLLFFFAALIGVLPVFAIAYLLRNQRFNAWVWAWLGTGVGVVLILQVTGVIWTVLSWQ